MTDLDAVMSLGIFVHRFSYNRSRTRAKGGLTSVGHRLLKTHFSVMFSTPTAMPMEISPDCIA